MQHTVTNTVNPGFKSSRKKKFFLWQFNLRRCSISNHTFWLHKTRQDTFYFTSFMDFISFHDLHVSMSIYLFYCHLYDQFRFIHTFICLVYASVINFNLSIHLYVLFKSFLCSMFYIILYT